MSTTPNLNLVKPALTDNADIAIINTNMDLIDTAVEANITGLATANTSIANNTSAIATKEPTITTKNSAFNQNFETSTANIKMDGIASIGASVDIAKSDHIHPSDTTKANQSDLTTTNGNVTTNATNLNSHLADYVRNPAFGASTGSANTYLVSTTPAPTALVDGMSIYLDINVTNTGASTLNWNGLGARSFVDGKGAGLIAGKLTLDRIVGVRYNASTMFFQLLGEGGDYGTALNSDVLSTKTLGTNAGVVAGTMANITTPVVYGALDNPQAGRLRLWTNLGYYGPGAAVYADDANFIAANILSGKTIFGQASTMNNLSGSWQNSVSLRQNWNGGVAGYGILAQIPQGYSDGGVSTVTNCTDVDFIPTNIISGKSPFGLAGTATAINPSIGNNILVNDTTLHSNNGGTPIPNSKKYTINYLGGIRISYNTHTTAVGSAQYAYFQIYKNGVAIGIQRVRNYIADGSAYPYVVYTEDYTCNVGDYFQLYAWASDTGVNAQTTNFQVMIATILAPQCTVV